MKKTAIVFGCVLAASVSGQTCVEQVGSVLFGANDSDAAGGLIYVATGGIMGIYELDGGFSQTSPVGSFDPPGSNHNAIIVSGDRVLVGYAGGVNVIDVSDPTNPTLVEQIEVSNQIKDFEQAPDGTIYASASVININPTGERDSGVAAFSSTGTLLGFRQIDTANFSATYGLAATDTAVYQARDAGVFVYPVVNGVFTTAPFLLPGTETPRDAVVSGDYLYVGLGNAQRQGIVIFSGVGTPVLTEIGFEPMDAFPLEMAISGDRLLVAVYDSGSGPARLYSIADPADPVRLDADLAPSEIAHWSDGLAFTSNAWFDVSACAPPCPSDFDSDGDVDLGDFGVFGAAFGSSLGDANFDPSADLDNDGDVDLGDFGAFGAEFGRDDC